eukprot:CAMPEP_0180645920 /NCGR_PEP_ID=MMETSP1037_2-20121125/49289_1 /TAXON_ID=632150 /ORGANISM="Azadinium spinosum, Strain 3D9" /LENGTH=247 /DNA_ID=CAMNT_0022669895 /DNA_START=30 /DNA_END=774 /DNA_ORIENTATION=-
MVRLTRRRVASDRGTSSMLHASMRSPDSHPATSALKRAQRTSRTICEDLRMGQGASGRLEGVMSGKLVLRRPLNAAPQVAVVPSMVHTWLHPGIVCVGTGIVVMGAAAGGGGVPADAASAGQFACSARSTTWPILDSPHCRWGGCGGLLAPRSSPDVLAMPPLAPPLGPTSRSSAPDALAMPPLAPPTGLASRSSAPDAAGNTTCGAALEVGAGASVERVSAIGSACKGVEAAANPGVLEAASPVTT